MSALTGEALAERLATLTEEAVEEAKTSIIAICFDKAKDDPKLGHGLKNAAGHARHMMVLVIAELFASAIQGVIDDTDHPLLAKPTNDMINALVGDRLVALHKLAKAQA